MATNKNFIVKNGLEVDGNTLHVDPDNNRVGIKTNSPSYDLDVNGTSRFVGNVNLDNELIIDNTNSNGLTITGGVGDTYPHITLSGDGPQTIKFLDISNAQGLELVYRTSPDELKIEKGFAYTLFSAARDTGAIKLYYGNSLKWETTNTGVKATGNIVLTGNMYFDDNQSARFGASDDLQIYHDATFNNSVIVESGTGDLLLGGTNIQFRDSALSEIYATFSANGGVSLYHDNIIRLETTSTGISVVGNINLDDSEELQLGTSNDLRIFHDGSNSVIKDDGTGDLYIQSNKVRLTTVNATESYAIFTENSSVELYFDNSKKIETTTSGVTVTGTALATQLSTGASGTGINITTNSITGPSTLTLDPAGVGDNTGTVVIAGNLQVDGTTTTINSTTVNIDDLNLTLASGAVNAAAANGAGITIDGANASLTYVSAKDSLNFNKDVVIGNDDNGDHASYVSSAALRVDGDSGVGLFVYNNAQSANPAAVFYKNDDTNNVPAVIISSDADDGGESILDVRGRVSQNGADLSATSDSADTILDVRGDKNVYVTGNIYSGGRYGQTNYRVLTVNDEGSGNGLDADTVDGKHVGTSGNTIPLLDGTNTFSGVQTFSNEVNINRYGNTHFSYGSNNDNYITFGSTGITRFRSWNGTAYADHVTILSSGNTGFGVTNPSEKIEVSGNIKASGNITNGGFDFVIGNTNQSTRGNSGLSRALVKDASSTLVLNYAGDFTGGVRVDSAMVVAGNLSTNTGFITANTAFGNIQIGPVNSTFAHITTDRDKFYFNKPVAIDDNISSYNSNLDLYTSNFANLRVHINATTGNVGIGTSSAINKLEVAGTGGFLDSVTITATDGGGTGGAEIIFEESGNTQDMAIRHEMADTDIAGYITGANGRSLIVDAPVGNTATDQKWFIVNGNIGVTGDIFKGTTSVRYLTTADEGTLNAGTLDSLDSTAFLRSNANNDNASGNVRTSGSFIEAGKGSGSVALTINDGYGNANIAFNHLSGVPDVTGSSGRIVCDVDSSTARFAFNLKNSTTANTAVSLTEVMSMVESGVTIPGTLNVTGTTTLGTTSLGTQTWTSHITWNNGQNIYISGESSFDVQGSGQWQLWDATGSPGPWITATAGGNLFLNNNARGVVISSNTNSTDTFQIRHRTDTDIYMNFYCESGTAQIADTFTDTTTDKKYIYFSNPNGSNDPGYIMHETSNATSPIETNEGVLHLAPSDDNGYGDYVSIHGTDDADCLKLHTDGTIETATGYTLKLSTATGSVTIPDGNTSYGLSSLPSLILGTDGTKAGTIKLSGGTAGQYSLIQHTTNNLHLDATGNIFLGYYDDGIVFIGNTTGTGDSRLAIYKAANGVSDHIQFYNGTTRVGEIGCEDNTWLRINQETNVNIYTPRYIRADSGFFVDGTAKGIDGDGNFIGGGGVTGGTVVAETVLRTDKINNLNGQQLVLNAGESDGKVTGQTGELVYINAENGLQVNSSSNNWTSPYTLYTANICNSSGQSTFPNTVHINAGNLNFNRSGFGAIYQDDNSLNSINWIEFQDGINGFRLGGNDFRFYTGSSTSAIGTNVVSISSSGIINTGERIQFNGNTNASYDTAAEIPTSNNMIIVGADNGTLLTTPANLNLYSWYGVGFGPSITGQPVTKGELSHLFNVRNGDAWFRGTLTIDGNITTATNLMYIGVDNGNTQANSTLAFRTDGTVRATLTNDDFDIYNNLFVGRTNVNNTITYNPAENSINLYGGASTHYLQLTGRSGTASDPSINLVVSNATKFRVNEDGKLGVGTAPDTGYLAYLYSPSTATGDSGLLINLDGWANNTTEYGINIDIDSTATDDITANRTQYGILNQMDTYVPKNASSTDTRRFSLYGAYNNAVANDNPATNYVAGKLYQHYGSYNRSRFDAAGGAADIRGAYNLVQAGSHAQILTTTAASGTGSVVTLTFAAQAGAPFPVGSTILVETIVPTAYRGTFTVTACTTTTVSYNHTATGAQTTAGTVELLSIIDQAFGTLNYVINSSANHRFTSAFGTYNHINSDVAGGSVDNAFGSYNRLDHDAGTAGTGYLFYGTYEGTWSSKFGLHINGETTNYLSGNLGLGTTSPSQKLTVIGNILLDSTSAERQLQFNNGTTTTYFYGQTSAGGGNVGMYDATNGRGVWYYSPSANRFVVSRNTTLELDLTLNGEFNMMGTAGDKYLDFNVDNGTTNFNVNFRTTQSDTLHETAMYFRRDAEVALYFDNNYRFNTASDGARVISSGSYWAGMGLQNNYPTASLEGGFYLDFRNESGVPKGSIQHIYQTNGGSELRFSITANNVARGTDTRTQMLELQSDLTAVFNQRKVGLGVAPGGTFGSRNAALCLGDNDTGIAQNGDGQLELWANNQEVVNITNTQVDIYDPTAITYGGNQLLLHTGGTASTVIHRNDGSDYYVLLSAAGSSASGTWNTLRPLTINLATGVLSSSNGQSFAGGTTITGNMTASGQVQGTSLIGNQISISSSTIDSNISARLSVGGTRSFASFTTGLSLAISSAIQSYTGAATTINTPVGSVYISAPSIASSTNQLTITNSASLYIDGPPVAGINTVLTNRYALYVGTGPSYLSGDVTVGGVLNVDNAIDLKDNDVLRLGSADDWEFFHNGTHNYMDLNVGDLIIRDNTTTRFTFERTTGMLRIEGNSTTVRAVTSGASPADGTMLIRNTNTSMTTDVVNIQAYRAATSGYTFLRTNSNTGVSGDNEHILRGDGQAYCDGSWNGGGADYAEYFEWLDGNESSEDRRGICVVLEGNKIRPANEDEDPIGVISGNPSVVGDAAWNKWTEKYLKDEFNGYIMEPHNVIEWEEIIETSNENTTEETKQLVTYEDWNIPENIIIPENAVYKSHDDNGFKFTHRKLNPDYNPNLEYIPREYRPEWDAVGLMGKLRIRKGQPVGSRWIKMRDISDSIEEWLVR
jgi:hypothetical protein